MPGGQTSLVLQAYDKSANENSPDQYRCGSSSVQYGQQPDIRSNDSMKQQATRLDSLDSPIRSKSHRTSAVHIHEP
jgi:hypothetical protein